MTDRRARAQLWNNLRLLVLDLETAVAPAGTHRIVSIAAMTCLDGKVTGRWAAEFVNPEVPIDPVTASIHGLTDDHVRNAPRFAAVATELAPLLRPSLDETLVLVAHNVRFDIPVLRAELQRVGKVMPDLPVLDTMGGLRRLAGVSPTDGTLAALLDTLGITNLRPHTATADAQATSEAVCALLNRAADAGHDHLGQLLAGLHEGRSATLSLAAPGRSAKVPVEPDLSSDHIESHHTKALPARAGKRAMAGWLASVVECAHLRCSLLADRVASAETPGKTLVSLLLDGLRACAASRDTAATATLLGAILPRLADLPPATTGMGNVARRTAATNLDRDLGPLLDDRRRCVEPLLCPACRSGESCPLDVWRLALAPAALGGEIGQNNRAAIFFETTGREAGTGGYATMCRGGHQRLADAVLRLIYRYWVEIDQRDIANALVRQAIDLGCLDPEIGEARAMALASAGRKADLDAALRVCEHILAARDGSTDEAWRSLAIRHAQIGGRLRRFQVRYTDKFDADGSQIPVRRHHPANPHRTRAPRFLRPTLDIATGPGAADAWPGQSRGMRELGLS